MREIIMCKRIIILLSLLFTALTAFSSNLELEVRFQDKQVYFPNSEIRLKVDVINDTSELQLLELANNRVFNLDFTVKTLTNRTLPHSEEFTIRKTSHQAVFYREVQLGSGERYSFEVLLGDYIQILEPGMYMIQARFSPKLEGMSSLMSNWLNLDVRPGAYVPTYQARIDAATKEVLQKEALPPDQVVEYTIKARQSSSWNKFFLYMDLESLYLRDDLRKEQYFRMNEEERYRAIEDFREAMSLENISYDISTIPWSYEIQKTSYTPTEGTVDTIQKFRNPDYTEIKQFTYYLRFTGGYWQIYDYKVSNLGTE